jgi:hypothetical protein
MSWHKSTMTSSRNALLRLLLLGLVCSNQQVAAFFQAFQGKPTPAAPKVKIPANFVVPEPKPLSITRVEGVPDLISSSAALALRFASGVFCVGWKPTFSLAREDVGGDDEYSLKLGPLVLKDTSELIPTLNRPTKTLVGTSSHNITRPRNLTVALLATANLVHTFCLHLPSHQIGLV